MKAITSSTTTNRSGTGNHNNIAPVERILLPPGTSLQQVTFVTGEWTPRSCKVFTVRCPSSPRVLGTMTFKDRHARLWEYPVVPLSGFGRTDAKFAVLTAVKRIS
jgi:hypothetical protein